MRKLQKVILPSTVKNIGEGAFRNCVSLESIVLSDSVETIGNFRIAEAEKTKIARIEDCVLVEDTLFCEGMTGVTLPEGVTEIPECCFADKRKLQKVTLPSTLKKIGKEAFSGCRELESVSGTNGAITYGKDVFEGCKKLDYTAEMFRNTGKLCDSFADHMESCGTEELAWVIMYQKGDVWERALNRRITKDNAGEILEAITAHIDAAKRCPKKQAEAAAGFVTANVMSLPEDGIRRFLDVLTGKKLTELAERIKSDPAAAQVLGISGSDAGKDETENQVPMKVMPDGSILYGEARVPLAEGACFYMGNEGTRWRILSIDKEKNRAVVIADREICEKAYNEERKDITWEQCTLRKWLNGEYYAKTFSDDEKEAIIECEVKNPDNKEYHTRGGADTKDRVWLLSIGEARKYFKNYEDRGTGSWWWLRSPGYYQYDPAFVRNDGSVDDRGRNVRDEGGVRPAFLLNLNSLFFQSLLSAHQSGETVIRNPELVIRNGVVLLSADPFVTEVILPSFVKEIGAGAFKDCRKLSRLNWEADGMKIDPDAFCSDAKPELPEKYFEAFYRKGKLPDKNFAGCVPEKPKVLAGLFLLSGAKSSYRQAAIEKLTIENAQETAEEILALVGSMKKIESTENIMRFLLASYEVLSDEIIDRLCDFLKPYEENAAGIKAVQDAVGRKKAQLQKVGQQQEGGPSFEIDLSQKKNQVPVIAKGIFDLPKAILTTDEKDLQGLPGLLEVLSAVSDYAKSYSQNRVDPSEYKNAALDSYRKEEEAEALGKELDHAALMHLLKVWQEKDGEAWYASYAAYADEKELAELLQEMKAWSKDKTLRERIIRVRGAILLNDSNDAMRYADSMGLLGRYAALRGTDEDTVRDSMMSDLGLDETGHKTWTLAGKQYLLTLNRDLTVTLTDESGKVLRSIPKKGADPEEHEAVNREFNDLKKDVKPTAKLRNDRIFAAFLSGKKRDGAAWKKVYLKNPLLRLLAQLIVWDQEGQTFVLKEDGQAYDADGAFYEITDRPIDVAHPMEMGEELTAKWQSYFVENSLKQPFEQVWEPVTNASLVKSGRYDGCTVPLYTLMNKEKHGIIMEGRSEITLKDCSADLELIKGHHDWYNNDFEVKNFRFEKYTRQVNHIVTHLDKATVAGRIKKDDVSVAQWLDRFTPAQIREFVDLANESKATNVTALLLQYQQEHFASEGLDAFDEFTLDLL